MPESFLVLGESIVDVVLADDGTTVEHAGGSPGNVAVALSRLGVPVELTTAFADDRLGDLLHARLAAAGVTYAGEPRILGRTSTAVATIAADGSATYRFDLAGSLPQPPPSTDRIHLHTGSVGAVLRPGGAVVRHALAAHADRATISYDINARPAVTGAGPHLVEMVEEITAASDLVKCSDEDLAVVYPRLPLEEAAARLIGLGPAAVVVTRGAAGATCVTAEEALDVPGLEVAVADTIGAGDSFCAALLAGLWREGCLGAAHRGALHTASKDLWARVLRGAHAAAAVTVSRPGADPPTEDELRRFATELSPRSPHDPPAPSAGSSDQRH